MSTPNKSSHFTEDEAKPFGPPLIGALLRAPWEAVRRRILERLHARGFADFDMPHLTVFQYPGPQGMRPSDLAAHLRVSKQAVNYLLGELERFGYLERRVDGQDMRSKRVGLTRRGKLAVRIIREAVREIEREWEQQLGPRRFAQLLSLLRELGAGIVTTETRQP